MSTTDYRSSHPLAWTLIAAALIAGVAAFGASRGWIPVPGRPVQQACADCGVVESVRAIETPVAPFDAADPLAADAAADAAAAAPQAGETAAEMVQIAMSYEITVRHEDGSTSVISQFDPPAWKAGDRVRVIDGAMLVAG